MSHPSFWSDTASLPRFASPSEDVRVDVAVIGGGITGITAAYLLKKAGKTVALLERGRCAAMDTAFTTAHLTAVTDLRLSEIRKHFGKEAVRPVWDAGMAAIDQIVTLIRAEEIACDFQWVPGFLHSPPGAAGGETKDFADDVAAAEEAGIVAHALDEVPFFKTPGIHFPDQALFHPRKYLSGLLGKIPGDGSYVWEYADAAEVETEPMVVKIGPVRVKCRRLVMATHNPLMGLAGTVGAALFQTKLSLYTSYALSARIPTGMVPEGSYWDTADPYSYLRVESRRGFDLAIYGGEDHKTGQDDPEKAYAQLRQRFLRLFPKAEINHTWSGQVIETADGLPYIGELTAQQFGATGFSGNGMTFGTLGGAMAADWAVGRKNPWTELFNPGRKIHHGGVWEFLKENKDYPYYMLRDRLAKAEGDSLQVLGKGQGKILSLGGKKVAAFRDESGKVTLCSPVCTHLKCIVSWNHAENTWDCPCHGSRFKPTGEVMAGPAEEPLKKLPAIPS